MNSIYSYLMEHQYDFAKDVLVVFIIVFLAIVFIDILKWKYYGK